MSKLASTFANQLVNWGLPVDNKEIYEYAIECLLNSILAFGIILIVSIIMGRFLIALIWILFFLPVRHTSGGLHAKTHWSCLVLSLSIGLGCIMIAPIITSGGRIIFPGLIFSILVIFLFAPVIHENHPLPLEQIKKIKKTARYIICIESCLTIVLFFIFKKSIAVAAVLGILSATSSTLIGRLIK